MRGKRSLRPLRFAWRGLIPYVTIPTIIALLSLKDFIIFKEGNNIDEQYKIKGIIEVQLKYIRKAWRVNLTVKYKAAAVPINALLILKLLKLLRLFRQYFKQQIF